MEPTCDMRRDCTEPIAYIDEKGYAYCTQHGQDRQMTHRCRKLQPYELNRLRSGRPLERY